MRVKSFFRDGKSVDQTIPDNIESETAALSPGESASLAIPSHNPGNPRLLYLRYDCAHAASDEVGSVVIHADSNYTISVPQFEGVIIPIEDDVDGVSVTNNGNAAGEFFVGYV